MKRFLVILGLTAIVWFAVSMAEPIEYTVPVSVRYTGYDTVRYALASSDSVVPIRVTSTGYVAFLTGMNDADMEVEVNARGVGMQRAVSVDSLYVSVKQKMSGVKSVSSGVDSLRITLSERCSKTFRPSLDAAVFEFKEQCGLYGQPVVSPAEVTLYGPEESLAKIGSLAVADTTLSGISSSRSYSMRLEPVWKQYGDVRPSCTEVSVYVPVESFVEREYSVPIQVVGADSTVTVHVYPREVTLHMWVAKRDLHREPEFTVTVNYADILGGGQRITPQLKEFPVYMRPRSIEPPEVQCVIIK